MANSLRDQLDSLPLKTIKAGLRRGEGTLNSVESAGSVITKALARAGISQKEAAISMDLSPAQFTRQLQGAEHLSWQRLFRLPDAFWLEVLFVLAEVRGIARVRRQIEEKAG